MKKRSLTEDERNTIINGLRVAAERFKENAATLLAALAPEDRTSHALTNVRLAQQFERQRLDSLALAEAIENAEDIEILTAPDADSLSTFFPG